MGNGQSARGAVLLEVVLALAIFGMGAVVILSGLQAALRMAQQVQFEAKAADLAVTVISEVQIGQISLQDAGPMTYEEASLAGWTWQVVTSAIDPMLAEMPPFKQVEAVIRGPGGRTYRLSQVVEYDSASGLVATVVPPKEDTP
jgi:type II secretory pathway pseudopilin PulG